MNIPRPAGFVGWVFVYYKSSDNKFQLRQVTRWLDFFGLFCYG
jgi:hypothetical protein